MLTAAAKSAYGPSPTKRRRRTKAEMEAIRQALYETLKTNAPMTVRQVFYALTTQGVLEKTEAEYKTVCRLLTTMRKTRVVPYDWLADATRWQRRPQTFSSMEEALRRTASTYRRALWDDVSVAVEIWVEKEALAGVLAHVTEAWDVPLMVTRGCPSLSSLYSAAEAIGARFENGQRTAIYYFGDHDPTGVDIDRQVKRGIGEALASIVWEECSDAGAASTAFEMHADFERVAVTADQISAWNLPTRPTKKTDSRSRSFTGESVELDAIPAGRLRQLAKTAIERHVDLHRLRVLQAAEGEERRILEGFATEAVGVAG